MPSSDWGRNGWMCQVGMATATQVSSTHPTRASQTTRDLNGGRHGAIQSETATRRPSRISQMKPARWA